MLRFMIAGCLALLLMLPIFITNRATPEEQPAKKDSSAKKPATVKVEKKPFKVELTVKGILEASESAEILYRPQPMVNPPPTHGPVTIRKVAEHGARVRRGDLLAAFDTRKLDEVIRDAEVDKKVLDASIKIAEEDLPLSERSLPVDLATAEDTSKRAREDMAYFLEVARPQAIKDAEFSVKFSAFFLEYAREELGQLEKMYKANDLTEETEKIILKRQRHRVEMAEYFLRSAQIDRDFTLKTTLPRKEQSLKEALARQEIQLDRARKTFAPILGQKQQYLIRLHHDRDKINDRLDKLHKDRTALTIHSPIDGIVYHGKFHKGQWSLSSSLENKLGPDGTVSPDEVFMTVVKDRPAQVRLTIEEKDAYLIKPGLAGKVKLVFNPDVKLSAKVARISSLPSAPGQFEALVTFDAHDADVKPGMACSVQFVPYAKKDAIAIPTTSLLEEDDKYYVYIVGKDNKQEKREVTPGRTAKERREILSGLRAGEEILQELPGDKKSEKGSHP